MIPDNNNNHNHNRGVTRRRPRSRAPTSWQAASRRPIKSTSGPCRPADNQSRTAKDDTHWARISRTHIKTTKQPTVIVVNTFNCTLRPPRGHHQVYSFLLVSHGYKPWEMMTIVINIPIRYLAWSHSLSLALARRCNYGYWCLSVTYAVAVIISPLTCSIHSKFSIYRLP